MCASRPSSPTRPGRPTSPTTGSPAATDVEILCWLDDHARYALRLTAHERVTGSIVLNEFRAAIAQHGVPASTLTDNGMVFTTRLSGGKGGRNAFEAELRRLGIRQKNSRPNHPTTCGKVERFHQTLKRWLTAQADQPETISELQALLEVFAAHYNHERPHRSLPERCTPADAYQRRPKATAGDRGDDTHDRVRHDVVDKSGKITLRVNGRMHHIGLGAEHRGTRVIVLVPRPRRPRHRTPATGELIRKLTIDPTKDYQPLGRATRTQTPSTSQIRVQGVSDVSRHHMERTTGFEPATPTLARLCSTS